MQDFQLLRNSLHLPPTQVSLKSKMCLTSVHHGALPFPHYLLLDGSAILCMYHWRTLKSPARCNYWSPTYQQVLETLQVLFLYQACCWSLLSRSWPNSQNPQSAKMPRLSVGNCARSHLCCLLEVPQSSVAHAFTVLQTWMEELFQFFFFVLMELFHFLGFRQGLLLLLFSHLSIRFISRVFSA